MQFPSAKWDKLSWVVLVAAVGYGIFARLYNLGRWELTGIDADVRKIVEEK